MIYFNSVNNTEKKIKTKDSEYAIEFKFAINTLKQV